MYLSRIAIDPSRRETMAALATPNKLHGIVEGCFAGERQRSLWRIDWLNGACYLMILSPEQPDFRGVREQLCAPAAEGVSRDCDALYQKLKEGQAWHFRLCANPTHRNLSDRKTPDARGKIYAYVRRDEQKRWLAARAEACGFTLSDGDFDVVHAQWLSFQKGYAQRHTVSLLRATFEGVLRVADTEKLKAALADGIGREKAYGCGLLTLAPIQPGDHA